jgi:DNA-binding LacI/PurR family transcriptional regulator
VHKVGYVPNTAARSLVRRRSGAIGFLVHEPHALFLGDPNIGAILLGANEVISDAGLQLVVLIVDSDRDARRVGDYLSGGFVDGAILISAREADPLLATVDRLALPSVLVGQPPRGSSIPHVGIDNRAAARTITERLQATGRRRIAMIACALDRDSGIDRLQGFTDALGPAFDPDLVARQDLYSYRSGVEAMHELLDRCPQIDGVFAASDVVAAGALETLRSRGRHVPEDVGVVGFDDSAWALRCSPPLSTVRQPAHLLGRIAGERVIRAIDRGPDDDAGTILPTSIVWRASA